MIGLAANFICVWHVKKLGDRSHLISHTPSALYFIVLSNSNIGPSSSANEYSISELLSKQFLLEVIESVNGDTHDEGLG